MVDSTRLMTLDNVRASVEFTRALVNLPVVPGDICQVEGRVVCYQVGRIAAFMAAFIATLSGVGLQYI
jgi:hypothetical protein